MSVNYKSTIFLPKTDFPMKAGLPRKEPEILKRWEDLDIYRRHREQGRERERFVLHDGPPYANGHIHMGTALNKVLKDVIVRSYQMLGYDANYVPGWDCHGLPIEWKIEEQYRAAGKDKDEVPIAKFRQECRDFATQWIDIQREEFKRLGGVGDWENPYTTMNFHAEAIIVRELGKFLMSGALYKGAKPVMWSVEEKTALAEAEVEYHDHTSTTIYVRFPIVKTGAEGLDGAKIVIWTTTPWTIPGNRAVAYGEGVDYVLVEVTSAADGSLAVPGERLLFADALVGDVAKAAGITDYEVVRRLKGKELEGTVCHHPLRGKGYEFEVRALPAGFVEIDTGTGFVHIAPGHGADDWELGMKHGVPVPDTVKGDGTFFEGVPLFAGKFVFDVNKEILGVLQGEGALLASGSLVHSYPHSWRSKAPLIFRNTAQWFISMENTGLRDKALKAIDNTRFVPQRGKTRLYGMIDSRPDWCVSRQRAWGVPITVFVHRESGEPLRDQTVLDRIIAAVEEEGADAWFTSDPARFLAPDYDPKDYEQVMDILDVWFDSGSTHAFVLREREDLKWPASLYLEGSDQHRGWFHSSLLESCGTNGVAPYEAVLTHGFVMAEDGQKMSKSLGNTILPEDVMNAQGADILRLWVVNSDYSEDLRIGPEILKRNADMYRRLRNTLRYLLGNLNGFEESERLPAAEMPELERWVLHRMWELDALLRKSCADFDYHAFFVELHNFCAVDLSAFYFDIRKDTLYCDAKDSVARRAARTVLDELFDKLTAWLAPFLCFTAEEAWLTRNPGDEESVHLRTFPEIPAGWRDDALDARWERVRDLRRVVTGALEIERAEKRIGASLQAAPDVYVADSGILAALDEIGLTGDEPLEAFLADLCITSGLHLHRGDAPEGAFTLPDVAGVGVVPSLAKGEKCGRCWKVLEDVGQDPVYTDVCPRCADAVHKNPPVEE